MVFFLSLAPLIGKIEHIIGHKVLVALVQIPAVIVTPTQLRYLLPLLRLL
jgi:hypothetical protein